MRVGFVFDLQLVRPEIQRKIALLPELIAAYGDLCNACVNVPLDENGRVR